MDFLDLCFVLVSALLLFSPDAVKSQTSSSTAPNVTLTSPTPAPGPLPCPTLRPRSRGPRLGFVSVEWGSGCTGSVVLKLGADVKKVCFNSEPEVFYLLSGVCEQRKSCRGKESVTTGKRAAGLKISENEVNETNCDVLNIRCEEERPPQAVQEPVGFRVATALLSVTLLLLLLVCFSKPTVRALQKRLSNKRKNRWIGPTQSHSVSYQRGQTVNKNLDGQKHSSYPALDRLVVGNPPSTRNSYNF